MMFISFLFPMLVVCHSKVVLLNNTVWIGNEKLVNTLNTIYEQLPVSVTNDVGQLSKRSFAIIADLLVHHIEWESPSAIDTLNNRIKQLSEPADVIAGKARKYLDELKALIDQPINDIKIACKPYTSDMQCVDSYYYYTQEQRDKCAKYENHENLRRVLEDFAKDKDFQEFLSKALVVSKLGFDSLAVGFFVDSAQNYKSLYQRLQKEYLRNLSKDYPCVQPEYAFKVKPGH